MDLGLEVLRWLDWINHEGREVHEGIDIFVFFETFVVTTRYRVDVPPLIVIFSTVHVEQSPL